MKLIKFFCEDTEHVLGKPVAAKVDLPQWYKDGETYYASDEDHQCDSPTCRHKGNKSAGLKTCMPVFDVLTSGYFLVTPFDIYVGRKDNGDLEVRWNGPDSWSGFIRERDKRSGETIPRPAGHMPNHLVWSNRWGWQTPRGYSIIVTHPFNRYDLPFTTMSGFMDSDRVFVNGNVPFFIKEDFYGLIPAGTPYAQLIPVKRRSWKSIIDQSKVDLIKKQTQQLSKTKKYYKKFLWVKKEYS